MNILVINGPNLNMLGIRQPEIYGKTTYEDLKAMISAEAERLGVAVDFFQSNHEGALVDAIQSACGRMDGIVMNPAAYTHTSVALLDALKAVELPAVEVHISDVTSREDFRQVSYIRQACIGTIAGQGTDGYLRAVDLLRGAGQVLCLGQGNHSAVALAAWAQFSTTSPKFKTIQDSHMQAVVLSTLSKEDVVIYFSYSGATHEALEAAEIIRGRGAKLILVTRYLNSPASAYADTVLLCGPAEQPFQFGSSAALIAQLYVVEVLLSEFVRRDPEGAERCRQSVGKALTQKCV